MRGKAAISDTEKQRLEALEAENSELHRGLLLWAEQKEELVRQGERGRRELETRCAGKGAAAPLSLGVPATNGLISRQDSTLPQAGPSHPPLHPCSNLWPKAYSPPCRGRGGRRELCLHACAHDTHSHSSSPPAVEVWTKNTPTPTPSPSPETGLTSPCRATHAPLGLPGLGGNYGPSPCPLWPPSCAEVTSHSLPSGFWTSVKGAWSRWRRRCRGSRRSWCQPRRR